METMLGPATLLDERTWAWTLGDAVTQRSISITLGNMDMGQGALACVVSLQTHQGIVQLHDVTGYLCIEPDEVMFIAKHGERFDSLVVGKSGTCSQFGNIRASLLTADLNTLDATLLFAAMQLSLAESLLETLP
jgi:hypothetical protein